MKQSSEDYPETFAYNSEKIEFHMRKARRLRAEYLRDLSTKFARGIVRFLMHGRSAPARHPGSTLPV